MTQITLPESFSLQNLNLGFLGFLGFLGYTIVVAHFKWHHRTQREISDILAKKLAYFTQRMAKLG